MMKYKSLLVIPAVALSLGATGCGTKAEPAASGTPASTELTEFRRKHTVSQERAQAWQSNAVLLRVYRQFQGSLESDPPAPLVFAYSSLAEPTRSFEVAWTGDSPNDRRVAEPPYALNFIPLDKESLGVDPDTALRTAEDGGGRSFREQHLAGYTVLQQLQKYKGAPMEWYVRYDTGDGSRLRYEIWIDGQSGTIKNQKEGAV